MACPPYVSLGTLRAVTIETILSKIKCININLRVRTTVNAAMKMIHHHQIMINH